MAELQRKTFTVPPQPPGAVPGFGPTEPILSTLGLQPFAQLAQAGAQRAAQLVGEDAQRGLDVLNDPRNAWIGTSPVGRAVEMPLWLLAAGLKFRPGAASKIALNPHEMDPRRFDTVKGHGDFHSEQFPMSAKVRIEHPPGPMDADPEFQKFMLERYGWSLPLNVHEDEIKGLNMGHALRRAADSWPSATRIQVIGKGEVKKK